MLNMDIIEPLSGNPNELSLNHQLDLVANVQTPEGIKQFEDALVNGRLTKTISLVLADPDKLTPNGEPYSHNEVIYHDMVGAFESIISDSMSSRIIRIRAETNPDKPQAIRIDGERSYGHRPDPNYGLHMQLTYRLVDSPQGQRQVQFDGGLIYVQTSSDKISDKMAYDAVIVLSKDGAVNNVLPPGDYHAERIYGSTVRNAEKRLTDRTLSPTTIHHLDQLEGSLEGVKLEHQRSENEYADLQSDVASLFGISPEELFKSKVDYQASFEATMNRRPLNVRPALHGTGKITVPPIIFSS